MHTEQLEFVDIYDRQLQRWQAEKPSATQKRELDRLGKQNRRLREVTMNVLATAKELRQDTINRVMAKSDPVLGLAALRAQRSSRRP